MADVARHAAAFDVTGLPRGALEVGGRFISSRREIKLDGLSAKFAGARARVDGAVRLAREPSADLRFELAADSLRRLQQGLPAIPVSVSGNYAGNRRQARGEEPQGPNRRERDLGAGVDGAQPAGSGWKSTSPRLVWI